MRRVLVCGSRDWSDPEPIRQALVAQAALHGPLVVIHGAARGADSIAGQVARSLGFTVEEFPADWRGQGKAAGHIRNKLMLTEGKPDVALAYKADGAFDWTFQRGGTENMVRIAVQAGVETHVNGRSLSGPQQPPLLAPVGPYTGRPAEAVTPPVHDEGAQ